MKTYPKRKNIRMKEYDYSQNGDYFITLCSEGHKNIFSDIIIGEKGTDKKVEHRTDSDIHSNDGSAYIKLKDAGEIAEEMFSVIEEKYGVNIIESVIMPNHIHFIIRLPEGSKYSIAEIIGGYKSLVYSRYRRTAVNKSIPTIWQRNYYEHIIRNDRDYEETVNYIIDNPWKWHNDELYTGF